MKRRHLASEEKNALEIAHHSCENEKERDRIRTILLCSEGWTAPQISQALRIHQSTIIRHIQDYQTGKLKNESGGSSAQLSETQAQELIIHLEANLYHHNHQCFLHNKKDTLDKKLISAQ